jgi:hypothetical protein
MLLRDSLAESVANWERLGHPALLERFVLRNGKAYTPRKRIGRKRKAKECFSNATQAVWDRGGTYVEGFVARNDFWLPLLHAWVTIDGSDAMDPTLDAKNYQYYGVEFSNRVLNRELVRNKHYGLLDTGLMLNMKLMFEIDPELEEICTRIKSNRRSA